MNNNFFINNIWTSYEIVKATNQRSAKEKGKK